MGNPDKDATIRFIEENQVEPSGELKDRHGVVMFKYDELAKWQTDKFVDQLMTDEMRQWITKQGYKILEHGSPQEQAVLDGLNEVVNQRLRQLGVKTDISIGKPVVWERLDPGNPRRIVNVIFAALEKKGSYSLVIHPLQVDPKGQLHLAQQYRGDGEFAPSMQLIEPKHPFGYREVFESVVSYPVQKADSKAGGWLSRFTKNPGGVKG